jgi:ankyrin repeat protein
MKEALHLIPETEYKFKLRLKFADDFSEEGWSRKSLHCDLETTDESDITKAYDTVFKCIRDDKAKALQEIVDKYKAGHELDFDVRDKSGKTLLMIAASHCSYDTISVLLHAGADPKITTISGKSPLTNAITSGNLAAVRVSYSIF